MNTSETKRRVNTETVRASGLKYGTVSDGELIFAGGIQFFPKSGRWHDGRGGWYTGDGAAFVAWMQAYTPPQTWI